MDTKDLLALRQTCKKVCIDSRQVQPGDLFIGLPGEKVHGQDYAQEALDRGAKSVWVEDEQLAKKDPRIIAVPDTLKALQEVASAYRDTLSGFFFAVTGSSGKTTLKNLLYQVFASKYPAYQSPQNYNSHIGLPVALLNMPPETKWSVFEMGARRPGDIRKLCEILKPTHGLVTNVLDNHLETFGSLKALEKTKKELVKYLGETEGAFFYPSDDSIQSVWGNELDAPFSMAYHVYKEPFQFNPHPEKNIAPLIWPHITQMEATPNVKFTALGEKIFETPLLGKHNMRYVSAASAIAKYYPFNHFQAHDAMTKVKVPENRLQWVKTKRNQVLMDAYNASPASMSVAIDIFLEAPKTYKDRPKLVLGGMKELGSISQKAHRDVLDRLKLEEVDVYAIGAEFGAFKEDFKRKNQSFFAKIFSGRVLASYHFLPDREAFEAFLKEANWKNQYILLKASRSFALEKLVEKELL